MTDAWVWHHCGLLLCRAGSVRMLTAPGLMIGRAGRLPFAVVLGQSVTIFDGRADYLPFRRDAPDAPGFWLGRFYVAFNRGKSDWIGVV